jgi:hypothetical protein
MPIMKFDSQVIEQLGKNLLIEQLLRAKIEIAEPIRDRGIDLIAYLDNELSFKAIPIQLKASSNCSFNIDKKYLKFPDLLIAYVWNVDNEKETVVYILTYKEAMQVATEMGYTNTASWKKGSYTTTKPSQKLLNLLSKYQVKENIWYEKVSQLSRVERL